jgi:quinol-cytochrome oxidoreductase complex cytochrome b subunit
VLLLVALPLIDRSPSRQPSDRRGVILVGTLCVAVFLVVTAIGNLFRGPAWAWRWPWGQ